MELFLESEFGKEKLEKDLSENVSTCYFIFVKKKIRGFMKVDYELPVRKHPEKSSELVKIYILPQYKGKGYGSVAMLEVVRLLREKWKDNLFLHVITSKPWSHCILQEDGFFLLWKLSNGGTFLSGGIERYGLYAAGSKSKAVISWIDSQFTIMRLDSVSLWCCYSLNLLERVISCTNRMFVVFSKVYSTC